MRPLRLLALAAAAAALQFSPVKPLRRRALQRRIRREADFISSPARGMDPEVLIQDDDALDDLVRKHNNLVEELKASMAKDIMVKNSELRAQYDEMSVEELVEAALDFAI